VIDATSMMESYFPCSIDHQNALPKPGGAFKMPPAYIPLPNPGRRRRGTGSLVGAVRATLVASLGVLRVGKYGQGGNIN
jgi:hypothetical protein